MFEGKCVLISGGSRGIGRAIAAAFYAQGAEIIIMSRHQAELRRAAQELDSKHEGRVQALVCDVGDQDAVAQAFAQLKAWGKSVNIMVNCAGVNLRAPLAEMSVEIWQQVLDINLTGTFLLSKQVFPMMQAQGGGKIINIASLMSEIVRPGISAYVASKGGVKMFTKAIAVEWAPYNIQANAIIPGYIETELNAPLMADEKFNQFIVKRTPAGRWGKPEDVAAAALFLASSGADFITGQVLAVDGGILAAL